MLINPESNTCLKNQHEEREYKVFFSPSQMVMSQEARQEVDLLYFSRSELSPVILSKKEMDGFISSPRIQR